MKDAVQRMAALDRLRRLLRTFLDERDDKMEGTEVHDLNKWLYERSAGVIRFVPVLSILCGGAAE